MEKIEKFKRGVVNFALDGSLKEKALSRLDESQIKKADRKAAKAEKKEQRKIARREAISEMKSAVSNFNVRDYFSTSEEVKEGFLLLTTKDYKEQFEALEISSSDILDGNMKKFEKTLTGQMLLGRDLNASPLFIEDEGNIIKVESARRVYSYDEAEDYAYVLLTTKYEYFVIKFDISYKF